MANRLIEVTQEDIDHGEKQNCGHCPIALAMDRELGGQSWAAYCFLSNYPDAEGNKTMYATRGFDTYETPPAVQVFITEFDKGHPVRPFSFELGDPCES